MLSNSTPAYSSEDWKACCWVGEYTCCGDRCEASPNGCCANEQCDTPPWNEEME